MQVDRGLLERLGSLGLRSPALATGLRPGDRRSPFLGRGMEFADYRDYHPGDDLRLVDWNAYARLQVVLVRLFHEDRDLVVRVALDASASLGFGNKPGHAATLTAALALLGLLRRDRVTLAVVGERVAQLTAHNVRGLGSVLDLLERAEPGGSSGVEALVGRGRTDRTLLVSDLLLEDEDLERLLRGLASSSEHGVVVHVLGEGELRPDLGHPLLGVDAESGEELALPAGSSASDRYQEVLLAWLEGVKERCRALRLVYVPAFTDVPLDQLLLGDLRRERVVGGGRDAP